MDRIDIQTSQTPKTEAEMEEIGKRMIKDLSKEELRSYIYNVVKSRVKVIIDKQGE